ncbi:MAG TPA: potassium channel family protein, partial [Solirubrobacteraceae bacterium]|nr:potassium channel family protein [Solirubrobacteraceae bacterium]
LLAATVILSLRVAQARPAVMRFFFAMVGAIIVLSFTEALAGDANGVVMRVSNLLLVMVCPPAIVLGILRTLRARSQVTVEAVLGVLCLYLLLGMVFAFLYGVIGRVDGTFFAQNVTTTMARCLYFSFITLTTVGYGDLTAASNLGHTLSATEALIGQIYLVTVVSIIVGNLGRVRMRQAVEPPPSRSPADPDRPAALR